MIRFLLLCFCLTTSIQLLAQVGDFAQINFNKADSVASVHANYPVNDLYGLSLKLAKDLKSDPEKFRAIYKWVTENIENDYNLYTKNREQRSKLKDPEALEKWNSELNKLVFKNLRTKRSTVCTGYAYLIKKLAAHAGIRCEIVNGYARNATANLGGEGTANHSWNVVQLNNKWYLCDGTWSSGAINLQEKRFVKRYDDTYFLLEPKLFIRNHYPLDTTYTLMNQAPTLNEFLNRPLVYVGALTLKISAFEVESFDITVTRGNQMFFAFQMQKPETIKKATLQITRSGSMTELSVPVQQTENGWCTFSHTFRSTGVHIVQVMLNNKYVFCYRVTVAKHI